MSGHTGDHAGGREVGSGEVVTSSVQTAEVTITSGEQRVSAQQGDVISVECLVSGPHAGVISPHWLGVISCFPETLSPGQYSSLLPCVDTGVVTQLYRQEQRPQDWCEGALAVKWSGADHQWSDEIVYRDHSSDLRQYCDERLSGGQVSQWYCDRARQCVSATSLPGTGEE